ncbi:DUF2235 domain-containing protein [Polaromonas jejuensis]|uniref:DUF2235 domain-containing protein n=1 Tax=Polaromonas jejuensis TaxID=457502 RepID=A0ABW0QEV5_9BURK|nr:DUF2235 domain-containing protein [Polaromonas jejuensis]
MTPRQLIVCCDGTNNNLTGGSHDTNVTKLCDLLAPEASGQLLYYDPGVGNPGQLPGATASDNFSRRYERLYGLAFGKGIYENIAEAYLFLMRHYQAGDQIFLYGFSRGAFTARSIGGLVTQFGLLRPEMESMVPTLLHVYFSDREKGKGEYQRIRAQISELFCASDARLAPIWFVGVWDTVASVGAPFLSRTITASPTIVGKRFHHVRQALALDEYRRSFEPRPYYIDPAFDYAAHGQSIRQLWFSGAHCDVGGGYITSAARLSNESLQWMLEESVACGLRLPANFLAASGGVDAQAVLKVQRAAGLPSFMAVPRVHSETFETPLWALAGLRLRDTHAVGDPGGPMLPAHPVEHPCVAQLGLSFPADTVWAKSRSPLPLVVAAVFLLVFWSAAGGLLSGAIDPGTMSLWQCLLALVTALPEAAVANLVLAHWQLGWWLSWAYPTEALPAFGRVAGALLADLGLIAAYGYIISRGITWAFARVAGLRRASQRPSLALNLLGMSGLFTVAADLTENMLTLLLVSGFPSTLLPQAELLVGLAMTAAALAKWTGLAACGALWAWGVGKRRRTWQAATVRG